MERPQHYDELHRPHQHAERRKNRLHPDAQAQQRTPRRLPGEHVDDQGVFGADSGRRERHDRREALRHLYAEHVRLRRRNVERSQEEVDSRKAQAPVDKLSRTRSNGTNAAPPRVARRRRNASNIYATTTPRCPVSAHPPPGSGASIVRTWKRGTS